MQNKGAIKFFAITFALVCFFHLSFTLCTRNVEKDARAFANHPEVAEMAKTLANDDPFKENFYLDSLTKSRENYYLDSISSEVVYNFLWIRKYTYRDCKNREINLGLDLKGGMNVTLEISIPDIVEAMAGKNTKDPNFIKAMESAREKYRTTQADFLTLFSESYKEVAPNGKLASIFSFNIEAIKTTSTNDEVINILRKETESAVDRTYLILRTRIDRFGVAQPNIQKLGQSGRILVELPGVKEPERVRKLLQGTANLEFWKTYDFSEVFPVIEEADKKLAAIFSGSPDDVLDNDQADLEVINESADPTDTETPIIEEETVEEESPDTTDNLFDEKAQFQKDHPLFALLSPNFDPQTGQPIPGPVVGVSLSKDTAKINKMLNIVNHMLPRDLHLAWAHKAMDVKETYHQLIALKGVGEKGPALTGDVITDARQDFSERGGNEITMQMNTTGAKVWKKLTGENKGKSVAIVLDNFVYSFPTVQDEIPNGRSSITGNFTLEEAKDLANILKAGKLPAAARIVQEEIVGPTLGKESINAGLSSFVLAFILVLIYMVLYYNRSGFIADIALVTNIFFIFGVLSALGAVLTLPGIAGIVLTLGMAVDANVIIYERIREELRAGKGTRLAIDDGYKNAYSAIIDGNVTTLITGIVLVIFGSGPVQGFATTLIIGIISSMFTAILLSRIVFEFFLDRNKKIPFDNKYTRYAFTNTKIDFIGFRKKAYIISSILIVIGIGSLLTRGLNLGIDFAGGRSYIVRIDQNVKSNEVRAELAKAFGEAPEVKIFGASNQIKVTTKYLINEDGTTVDSLVERKLYEGIAPFFIEKLSFEEFSTKNQEVGVLSSQKVGATVARDIIIDAFWAILLSLIAIFVYIAIRFKKWQYGLGGLISLAHDALITISLFSLFYGILPFTLEIDQAFIAAILTIIGYSINDSVIIFDRIRENRTLFPKRSLTENMNSAMNSTLSRTVNTSGTTLIVLIAIFIFGGEVIRGFIFALLTGVLVGTYSSVFTASPLAFDFINWSERRKKNKK
ncbi:MAG: protein translocase subunit SecDF [Bacteroidales bacterium]|nr:protein translocase subunit SecDF [Bacteroidales bacterium]